MLHNRRKAEIEVLSCVPASPSRAGLSSSERTSKTLDLAMDSDDTLVQTSTNPLVRYLSRTINGFLGSSVR